MYVVFVPFSTAVFATTTIVINNDCDSAGVGYIESC